MLSSCVEASSYQFLEYIIKRQGEEGRKCFNFILLKFDPDKICGNISFYSP